VTTVHVATDPDDAVRLGWPGGVDPVYVATLVLSSPVTPAAVLARQLLLPLADPDDERAIRYAVNAVIAAERNITASIMIGLYGAYQAGGLPTGGLVAEAEFGGPPEPPGVAWVMNPAGDIADPDAFWVGTSADAVQVPVYVAQSDVHLDCMTLTKLED